MKSTTLLVSLYFVCSIGCRSLPSQEDLDRWKGNVDKGLGAVAATVDAVKPVAEAALAKVEALKADVDKATDELEAKGAPVDGSAGDLMKWAAQNPLTALGSSGSLATVLAGLVVGYRRKKKALEIVVNAIEGQPEAVAAPVKEAVAATGGKSPEIAAAIQRALA
jgi:hypothetical protein